jgi:hypothetical protein
MWFYLTMKSPAQSIDFIAVCIYVLNTLASFNEMPPAGGDNDMDSTIATKSSTSWSHLTEAGLMMLVLLAVACVATALLLFIADAIR